MDPVNLLQAQEASDEVASRPVGDLSLTEEEKQEVRDMQTRDREVRAHEQAHAAVGGQYAGSPQYDLERGPDGRSYAVSGHVSISTSPIPDDPQATIDKMDQVKKAALAPVDPSAQDRRVAADAEGKRAKAQSELLAVKQEELQARFDGESDAIVSDDTLISDRSNLNDGLKGFAEALDRGARSVATEARREDDSTLDQRGQTAQPISPGVDLVA